MTQTILAIDPGSSGGFAWMDENGTYAFRFGNLTEASIAGELRAFTQGNNTFAYIEQVGACGGGKEGRRQGANSMFTFGQNYGFLRGLLIGMMIPFEEVRPQKWLPAMGLRGIKDETQTQKKNRHKAKAEQLFPHIKCTHAIADALLLCEYARRLRSGQLTATELPPILATKKKATAKEVARELSQQFLKNRQFDTRM